MRIVIMGAGGIGGYFGARLAAAGNDVAFIARGEHLAAMRAIGLVVRSARGDLHLTDITATDDPNTLARADLVLIGVKLWDTEAAATAVKPLVRPGTAVVSFQKGIEKDDVLARILGREAVIGGTAQISVVIAGPGVIAHTGALAKLVIGELDNRRTPRIETIAATCQTAGIETEIAADIRLATWQKFAFLVAVSACITSMRQPIGPLRGNPQTRAFLRDVMREVVAVGQAQGVPLPADFADARLAQIDTLPADMSSSMHGDLTRGNRLEVAWLSGAVAALGGNTGVPTPLNRAVFDILAPYANGAPPG